MISKQKNRKWNIAIIVVSILIPLIVSALFRSQPPEVTPEFDLTIFPKFHAIINSTASLLLILGFYFIKQKNMKAHRIAMMMALFLSFLFLLSYITYHSLSESTTYGGEGIVRTIYYFVLITHIVLSAVIVPIVLFTFKYAWLGDFKKHKKLAKWTFPLWLYVTITGVLVYLMISPYY